MTQKYSAFSYKAGNSFVHKIPAWIKIIFVPLLGIAVFRLPFLFSLGMILFLALLSRFIGFTFREQLGDLRLVLYLSALLYLMPFLGFFCSDFFGGAQNDFFEAVRSSFLKSFSSAGTALSLGRLLCVMQTSSLLFKTTTSLEMREGVGKIEGAARRFLHLKGRNTFTDLVSFTLYFIPLVFKIWSQLDTAWKARQGKVSPRMFMALLPALFSVGMKSAYTAAKAVMIRSFDE